MAPPTRPRPASTRTWAISPAGYDGVDNDQDGLIDDYLEGVPSGGTNSGLVLGNLGRHVHKTARSEMLYAILVEGRGPLGSVFSRDDFTDKEVQDTDGDGLPEFVDAWGQPLQFYRWPVLFHSDLQRGQNFLVFLGQLFPATLRERVPGARAGPTRPQSAARRAGLVGEY